MAVERRTTQVALALALLPLVVSAAVLAIGGGDYLPISDHALTELRVRDIGRHPVLTGLFSRDDWSHPGPIFFYLLVPLYRLTGSASIAINIGALLVNGVAIVGMAMVARRRGGIPLLLCTLVTCSLLVRTLGADFVSDPWNPYVTVLPFGLLVLLTWAMTCNELWAVPAAALTATFLAQTHVGFVALALPLVALGATWLAVSVLRAPDHTTRGDLARVAAVTAAVTAIAWSPVVVDVLTSDDDNLGRVIEWFRLAEGGTHTLAEGWRVISAQLAAAPEWLVSHRPPFWATGESAFLHVAPLPWLLLLVVGAGLAFHRTRTVDGARLLAIFAATFMLGVLAVVRTVGLVFDYRLRWTWIIGALGFLVILWACWVVLTRWRPALHGPLVAVSLAVLAASATVNTVVALRGETPRQADSEALAELLPAVLDAVGDTTGHVLVDNGGWDYASWYTRSLVLQLERRGIDARMVPAEGILVGEHRVVERGKVSHRIVVAMDYEIPRFDRRPELRKLAQWSSVTDAQVAEFQARVAALDAQVERGELTPFERAMDLFDEGPNTYDEAVAWRLAVFVEEPSGFTARSWSPA